MAVQLFTRLNPELISNSKDSGRYVTDLDSIDEALKYAHWHLQAGDTVEWIVDETGKEWSQADVFNEVESRYGFHNPVEKKQRNTSVRAFAGHSWTVINVNDL